MRIPCTIRLKYCNKTSYLLDLRLCDSEFTHHDGRPWLKKDESTSALH